MHEFNLLDERASIIASAVVLVHPFQYDSLNLLDGFAGTVIASVSTIVWQCMQRRRDPGMASSIEIQIEPTLPLRGAASEQDCRISPMGILKERI